MELVFFSAALACGLLFLTATIIVGARRRDLAVPSLALMEAGMILILSDSFLAAAGALPPIVADGIGMAGLMAFSIGGPAFSAKFFGAPLPRIGAAARAAAAAGAAAACAAFLLSGARPVLASSLALYASLAWILIEGSISLIRMVKGPKRRFRAWIVAGTAVFLPFFVIDSIYGGGMIFLPAFIVCASVAGLAAVALRLTSPFAIGGGNAARLAAECGLSPRESEVAALIAEGLSNGRIADRLCISKKTVESHISSIYRKAGVAGRFGYLSKATDASR